MIVNKVKVKGRVPSENRENSTTSKEETPTL